MLSNYLEEFMEQVPETFTGYTRVEALLSEDRFHKFVREKFDLIYKETMDRYGHLIHHPKYHRESGSADLTNPDMLFDEDLYIKTDL